MVVQGILALALALPTGLLFGVGYGTGVRIGYEQVYPLLFPQDKDKRNVTPTVNNIKQINGIYNAIGGKEASQMGIAMGLQGAMEEIDRNPDFQALEALELRLSGRTQQRLGSEEPSKATSISDFPLGSSLDPNSPNFNSELYILVKKQQADNAPLPKDLGNKEDLLTFGQPNPKDIPSAKTLQTASDQEWITWSAKLGKLKAQYQSLTKSIKGSQQARSGQSISRQQQQQSNTARLVNERRAITSQIRSMSNDYRHPNNNIRENALRLRQAMASGQWK